ncbi:hypothetical protein [Algivirga pacifica]
MKKEIDTTKEEREGLPSLFKSWKQVYWVVIGELFFLIALFYGFTAFFSN